MESPFLATERIQTALQQFFGGFYADPRRAYSPVARVTSGLRPDIHLLAVASPGPGLIVIELWQRDEFQLFGCVLREVIAVSYNSDDGTMTLAMSPRNGRCTTLVLTRSVRIFVNLDASLPP